MAEIIARYPSEARARRALEKFSRPPDGWLEIETVETVETGIERTEYWIVAYPTRGSLAFEEWIIANTPSPTQLKKVKT